MYRTIILFCAATLFLTLSSPAASAETDTKDKAILEMLKVMNTMENMEASLVTMKDTIKMNAPYFLNELKIILNRELEEEDVNAAADIYRQDDFGAQRLYEIFRYKLNLERVIKEIMLPVYRKHYSEEEILQLTDFYKSELGQKTLSLTPEITREISSKTRDMSQMALSQAKDELAFELQKEVTKE